MRLLKWISIVTNLVFVSVLVLPSLALANENAKKQKFLALQASFEKQLTEMSKNDPEGFRQFQKKQSEAIADELKTLEAIMDLPVREAKAAYKKHILEGLDTLRTDLGKVDLDKAGLSKEELAKMNAESEENFKNLKAEIEKSSPDPEAAYTKLLTHKNKIESLGVIKALKITAAVFATIGLAVGGVFGGAVLIVVGIPLCIVYVGILVVALGAVMIGGSCLALRAIWVDWVGNETD